MKAIRLNLDIMQDTNEYIELMQGYDYKLECEMLYDGENFDLTGYTPRVEMLMSNGNFIIQATHISVKDNIVTVELDSDFTNESGEARIQIVLEKEGKITGSWTIYSRIKQGALYKSKDTKSKADITEELIKTVNEAVAVKEETENLIATGGAATKGDIASVNERLDNKANKEDLKNLENNSASKQEVNVLEKRMSTFTNLKDGSTSGDAELMDGRNTFFGTNDINIGEAIRKQMNAVYNGVYNLNIEWELGEMNSSSGENGSDVNPTQIRSKNFIGIPVNVDITFELTTNYNYFILKYDKDEVYQGYEGVFSNGTNILNTNCPYIKIAMANADYDTNVNVDMGLHLNPYFKVNSFKNSENSVVNLKNDIVNGILLNGRSISCYLVCQEHSERVHIDTFSKTITFPPSYICMNNKLLKVANEQVLSYEVSELYKWIYYNDNSGKIEITDFYIDKPYYYFLGLLYTDMIINSYCNFEFTVDKPLSIGFLGDSITYGLGGTSWTTRISELCGIPNVYNYGVSGTTIITNGSTGFIDRIPSMIDGLGAIGLWGGVNDFMWTNQSKEVFKANFEKVVKALLDKYPKAKIVGFTPMKFKYTADASGILTRAWNEPNSQSGVLLKDYVDAEIEIFNKYSIEYKDLFDEGGISCEHEGQSNEYFVGNGDLLHPNTKGNLLVLAPKIANTINSII